MWYKIGGKKLKNKEGKHIFEYTSKTFKTSCRDYRKPLCKFGIMKL